MDNVYENLLGIKCENAINILQRSSWYKERQRFKNNKTKDTQLESSTLNEDRANDNTLLHEKLHSATTDDIASIPNGFDANNWKMEYVRQICDG